MHDDFEFQKSRDVTSMFKGVLVMDREMFACQTDGVLQQCSRRVGATPVDFVPHSLSFQGEILRPDLQWL
jgi:hypothetical protein